MILLFFLPRRITHSATSRILYAGIQHHRANDHELPSSGFANRGKFTSSAGIAAPRYRAGLCRPFAKPSGCREQELLTIDAMSWNSRPQYLHSNGPDSRPSYATCMPFANPSGCFGHELLSNELRDPDFLPQYTQTYSRRSPPSYRACLPLPNPLGCFGQLPERSDFASLADFPQYLQNSL